MDSPYFDGSYFDGSYFDTGTAAAEGGGPGKRRASIFIQPPAKVEEVTDDGWIHIIL